MATKKIEDSIKKESEKLKNEKKLYTVRVPLDPLNPKDKDLIIGINDKYAKITRGEDVEVSYPVYEALRNANLV